MKKKIEKLITELNKMDEVNYKANYNFNDYFQIQLFPIGTFLIPKKKTSDFFAFFKIIDKKLIEHFNFFFNSGIVPVINSYKFPITNEGYFEGVLEYKTIKNFMNMYNARKFFYDNNFYKMKNNLKNPTSN